MQNTRSHFTPWSAGRAGTIRKVVKSKAQEARVISVKNGWYSETRCHQGMPSWWWQTFRWDVSNFIISTYDTIVWTDCDDAMAFPYAQLDACCGDRTTWGEPISWGSTPKAWCLSTDQSDGASFEGRIHGNICYRALILKPDGSVWYYLDQSYSPGRRMLDGIPVPTDEEVKDCELDPTRDNEECIALIDQILTYDLHHPENFVEVTDETDPEPVVPDWCETDCSDKCNPLECGVYSWDQVDSECTCFDGSKPTDPTSEEDNTEDDESSTDDVSSENDVSSAETATENSPVSNTLRRLLKA